jgi:hypothetical protein
MSWIIAISGILVGAALASLVFSLLLGKWYIGNLRKQPDPEEAGSYYFMEIAPGGLERIEKTNYVILRVQRKGYLDN